MFQNLHVHSCKLLVLSWGMQYETCLEPQLVRYASMPLTMNSSIPSHNPISHPVSHSIEAAMPSSQSPSNVTLNHNLNQALMSYNSPMQQHFDEPTVSLTHTYIKIHKRCS